MPEQTDNTVAIVAIIAGAGIAIFTAIVTAVTAHYRQKSQLAHDRAMSDRREARTALADGIELAERLEDRTEDLHLDLEDQNLISTQFLQEVAGLRIDVAQSKAKLYLHLHYLDPISQGFDAYVDGLLLWAGYLWDCVAAKTTFNAADSEFLEALAIDGRIDFIEAYSDRLGFKIDHKEPSRWARPFRAVWRWLRGNAIFQN